MDNQPTDCVLHNIKIWDGNNERQEDALLIENGKIVALGEAADFREHNNHRDMAGLSVLPGLIDAHVHLELNPDDAKPPEKTLPSVIPLMQERAAQMAQCGITTARDLGGGAWFELELRKRIQTRELVGPRLLCSGQPITSVQGHCHFWGGEAANTEQALEVAQRQVDKNVDLIKVMATGGRLTRGSEPTDGQFPQTTLDAIVDFAHQHNLPVAAHCHGTHGIHQAAIAGVDTIEHCSWVGKEGWASDYQEEVAKVILDQGVWISPTVNKGWQRMLDSKTGNVLKRVRQAYRAMLDMGIPMLASTDAGIPGVYHNELAHALVVFAKIAQLSNEEALKSATSDAALALRINHTTGTIQANLDADLLVVDGNPLADLSAITKPVMTFCRGMQVNPT